MVGQRGVGEVGAINAQKCCKPFIANHSDPLFHCICVVCSTHAGTQPNRTTFVIDMSGVIYFMHTYILFVPLL